jgi:hypothetical protein
VEQLGGISLQAWRQIIHHEGRSSEVAAGYLFAMMVATELQGRTEDEGPRSARRKSHRMGAHQCGHRKAENVSAN